MNPFEGQTGTRISRDKERCAQVTEVFSDGAHRRTKLSAKQEEIRVQEVRSVSNQHWSGKSNYKCWDSAVMGPAEAEPEARRGLSSHEKSAL